MTFTPKRLFILLGISAALAIIAFRAQSLLAERESLLRQRTENTVSLAQFAATYTARLYDQSGQVADEVADHVRRRAPDAAGLHEFLAAKARDTSADDYIVVLDAEGHVWATSETNQATGMSFAAPGFRERTETSARRIVPVLRSRLTGAVIYSLSSPLYDASGRYAGVVGVNVKPEGIQPVASRKPGDPFLTVWGRDGAFIAANFVDFDANGTAVPPPKPGGFNIPGSNPQRDPGALTAAAAVTGWPAIATASFDRAGILAPWRQDLIENLVLIALILMGLGVLVGFGIKTAQREEDSKHQLDEAVRERDLLLKEVHHRVKNSLHMTAGLIHLQEREFSDPAVKAAFEGMRRRIHSIGLVHEALYEGSSIAEVDLASYLERLLDELGAANGADARGISIFAEVEPLMLAPSQVTPVGLIVAEVVTNAFKYAFGEAGPGEIRVRGRLLNRGEVEIEIRDDGVGLSAGALPAGSGLGTRLIETLTAQLQGVLSISNEGGAAFRIVFPRD